MSATAARKTKRGGRSRQPPPNLFEEDSADTEEEEEKVHVKPKLLLKKTAPSKKKNTNKDVASGKKQQPVNNKEKNGEIVAASNDSNKKRERSPTTAAATEESESLAPDNKKQKQIVAAAPSAISAPGGTKIEIIDKLEISKKLKNALIDCLGSTGKGNWTRGFFSNIKFENITFVEDDYKDSTGKSKDGYKIAWIKKDGTPSKGAVRVRSVPVRVAYSALHGKGNLVTRPDTPPHKAKFYCIMDDTLTEKLKLKLGDKADSYKIILDEYMKFHVRFCNYILKLAWEHPRVTPDRKSQNRQMARSIVDGQMGIKHELPEECDDEDDEEQLEEIKKSNELIREENEKIRNSDAYKEKVEKLACNLFIANAKVPYKLKSEKNPNPSFSISRVMGRRLKPEELTARDAKMRPTITRDTPFEKALLWDEKNPRVYSPIRIRYITKDGQLKEVPPPKNKNVPMVYQNDVIAPEFQPSFYISEQGYGVCYNFTWNPNGEIISFCQGDRTTVGKAEEEVADFKFRDDEFIVDYEVEDDNVDHLGHLMDVDDAAAEE